MAQENILASAISGRLVAQNGAPASGVTIQRKWAWDNKSGEDQATTDAAGLFDFPAVPNPKRVGFFGRLSTPSIKVTVTAKSGGSDVVLLNYYKNSYSENSESPDFAPIYVDCHTAGSKASEFPFGVCRMLPQKPG